MTKSGKTTVIVSKRPSKKEILDQIDAHRIGMYKHQLSRIRVSNLSEDQKRIQSSFIRSRIQYIENLRVRN